MFIFYFCFPALHSTSLICTLTSFVSFAKFSARMTSNVVLPHSLSFHSWTPITNRVFHCVSYIFYVLFWIFYSFIFQHLSTIIFNELYSDFLCLFSLSTLLLTFSIELSNYCSIYFLIFSSYLLKFSIYHLFSEYINNSYFKFISW